MILVSNKLSKCCRQTMLFVNTTKGGFIMQKCVHCGDEETVKGTELPERSCPDCDEIMEVIKHRSNYHYNCPDCDQLIEIADHLMDRSEFEWLRLK